MYCGQTAVWIKMPLGTGVGLGPCHIVLHGDPTPPKKGVQQPPILAHVCCGKTAGWIKMPLGTEVDLGPGQNVLHGAQLTQERGTAAPLFSAHVSCQVVAK